MKLGIRQVVGALTEGLQAVGLKRDVSTDPAAPSPGPCFRISVDDIKPADVAQGDDVNDSESGRQYEATLTLIMVTTTSGGKGSTETTIDLIEWAERLDGVCSFLTNGSPDSQYDWQGSKVFLGAGGLTKLGATVLVTYR